MTLKRHFMAMNVDLAQEWLFKIEGDGFVGHSRYNLPSLMYIAAHDTSEELYAL